MDVLKDLDHRNIVKFHVRSSSQRSQYPADTLGVSHLAGMVRVRNVSTRDGTNLTST